MSGCKGKFQVFFSGASENENFCGFGLKSDGWKDLMSGKQAFVGASQDENISGIASRKNS
ncbi:MAG: hypothetical protein F6K40_09060 [Okeania sp. SIO3I5]|uniref:hypothetical protein n=1 Tax=Okeania sp. SIO3I5 TaxID=2607805 RepID=UPI0013BD6EAC|nr:hypothetical protein [Okeania sp. SIO3I5]NEQ36413.1 hypothetical protein [Okeania sp. SIO3I5]